jgi:phasin family protein
MANRINEFVKDNGQALVEKAGKLGAKPVKVARDAAVKSAGSIKALKDPIRAMSRSAVKLTAISRDAVAQLIELQTQVVTSALTDAANQLERAAKSDNPRELLSHQAAALRATRDRVVADVAQAVSIVKGAGEEARKVATQAYAHVTGKAEAAPARAKAKGARKTKRAVRKAPARKAK